MRLTKRKPSWCWKCLQRSGYSQNCDLSIGEVLGIRSTYSAGTMGHSILSGLPEVGLTLLARARELLKEGWLSSRVNVLKRGKEYGQSIRIINEVVTYGSPSVAVQVTLETRPEVTLVGVSRVKPRITGRPARRTLTFEMWNCGVEVDAKKNSQNVGKHLEGR